MCDNTTIVIVAVATVIVFVAGLVTVAYIGSESKDQNVGGYQPDGHDGPLGKPPSDE